MRPSYSVKNLKTQNSAKAPVRFENAGLKMHHSADTGVIPPPPPHYSRSRERVRGRTPDSKYRTMQTILVVFAIGKQFWVLNFTFRFRTQRL